MRTISNNHLAFFSFKARALTPTDHAILTDTSPADNLHLFHLGPEAYQVDGGASTSVCRLSFVERIGAHLFNRKRALPMSAFNSTITTATQYTVIVLGERKGKSPIIT